MYRQQVCTDQKVALAAAGASSAPPPAPPPGLPTPLSCILAFSASYTAITASPPPAGSATWAEVYTPLSHQSSRQHDNSLTLSSVSSLAGGRRGWTHQSSRSRCRTTLSMLMQVKKNSSNTAVQKSSASNSSFIPIRPVTRLCRNASWETSATVQDRCV